MQGIQTTLYKTALPPTQAIPFTLLYFFPTVLISPFSTLFTLCLSCYMASLQGRGYFIHFHSLAQSRFLQWGSSPLR